MPVDWSLLKIGDPGAAFQVGLQRGQEQRREGQVRGALSALAANPQEARAMGVLQSAAPETALRMEERFRERQTRQLVGQVFAGSSVPESPPTSALASYATSPESAAVATPPHVASAPLPVTAPPAATAPVAPRELVDPLHLPPRSDGIVINRAALRQLYAVDPTLATKVQQSVFDADAATFKRMQQSGEIMAQAAFHLSNIKNSDGTPNLAQRQQELAAMTPQLLSMGLSPEMLGQADLSDNGLHRYQALGRSIADLTREGRAERQLEWSIEDDRIDNRRADRSEQRQEYYRARSDRRAERADGRAAVRHAERDKDRAALRDGLAGVRTDLSDLEY